jgi:hypothetical protein
MYVDLNLSAKLLDCLVQGDRTVSEFIIKNISQAKACRFPAPDNDPR